MKLIARIGYKDHYKTNGPEISALLSNFDRLSVIKALMDLISNKNKELKSFIDDKATLRLIEHAGSLLENKEGIKEIDSTTLSNAYLVVNDELNSNEKPPHTTQFTTKLSHARFIIPLSINQNEIESLDPKVQLNTEIVKIKLLQDYFNQNPKLRNLEELFFKKFDIDSWNNYFLKIFRLILASQNISRNSYIARFDPLTDEDIAFYKNLEFGDVEIEEFSDFMEIRKHPIVRLNDTDYGVLYLPFLFDKIYKSVYFELSKIGNDNKSELGSIGKEFQSNFGKDFFEDLLCKSMIERAYKGKNHSVCLEEKNLGNLTDYYVRKNNRIFLFEFKNITIPKNIKCSGDFNLIENGLLEKLYESNDSGKKKPRAVKQLITCIQSIYGNLDSKKFDFKKVDNFLEKKKPIVYPIIIVQDYCLDSIGINYFLNEKFKETLASDGLMDEFNKQRIKNLTIIHIDYLIYLNDSLRDGSIKLHDLIDEYHRATNKGLFGNPISFGQFLSRHLNKIKNFNTKPNIWMEYLQDFIKN